MSEQRRARALAAASMAAALWCAPAIATGAEANSAAQLYANECSYCHGARGGGDGESAAILEPRPTKFSNPDYWKTADRKKMAETIAKGKAGTAMMPFGGRLSTEQISALVEYLETLAK